MKLTRRFIASWRARKAKRWAWRNLSGWDNPATGADLLAAMNKASRRRKNPLL